MSISVQDGERYDDNDGDPNTVINLAAEPGGFVRDGLLIGAIFGWNHDEQRGRTGSGQLEIGPRFAYYFSQSPHGSVFTEASVHFAFDDSFLGESLQIFSLGLGHLFPLSSRAALAPMVKYRYYQEGFNQTWSEGYEIEFRIGFRFFHYQSNSTASLDQTSRGTEL